MYSVVLMTALTAGAETPAHWFAWGCHGRAACYSSCGGCWTGCYGVRVACHGRWAARPGCWSSTCHGCHGVVYYHSCHGSTASRPACHGCSAPAKKDQKPAEKPADKQDATKKSSIDAPAKLIVELPSDAKLYVDGKLMQTTSDRRVFTTPSLEADQAYFYDLRAEVARDGQTIIESKKVIIRAGEVTQTTFSDLLTLVPSASAIAAKR